MEVIFNPQPTLEIDLYTPSAMEVEIDTPSGMEVEIDTIAGKYDGAYEVTPTREVQVLPTSGNKLTRDITIGAIPQNYGLITWDGSTLTVS